MKVAEVRELSDKELLEKVNAERALLDQMVLNHSVSPLDNPGKIKETRRNVARFLTVLRQRELNK